MKKYLLIDNFRADGWIIIYRSDDYNKLLEKQKERPASIVVESKSVPLDYDDYEEGEII